MYRSHTPSTASQVVTVITPVVQHFSNKLLMLPLLVLHIVPLIQYDTKGRGIMFVVRAKNTATIGSKVAVNEIRITCDARRVGRAYRDFECVHTLNIVRNSR